MTVADWVTSPRCTSTPDDHCTTYQRIVIGPGAISSVTLSNSSDVADARRPRTADPTGRSLSWLESKKRADVLVVTAVIGTVTIPLAETTTVPV